MKDTTMDLRTKMGMASFVALLGLLVLTAYASLNYAEPNAALTRVLFGQTH
ncbi:MAG: hypothetical protein RLZZ563_1137 [Pseudomonadota bacterium]|jgi:hypothetical protein